MCSMILIFQIHPYTLALKNLMILLTQIFLLDSTSFTWTFNPSQTILINYIHYWQVWMFHGITKIKLKLNSMPTSTFELEGYIIEHTSTKSSCGGTLLYTDHHINYKVHNNLKMYKTKELESIFIEILNQNSKNTITGCIYQHHPCMDPAEFNDAYLLYVLVFYVLMFHVLMFYCSIF